MTGVRGPAPDGTGRPRDAAGRTLTVGLVLLTLPVVALAVSGIVVLVSAASSEGDAGGFAVLFALPFLAAALVTSPVPILGWTLRGRRPQASAALVLVGGVLLALVSTPAALDLVLGASGGPSLAVPGTAGLLVGLGMLATGIRSVALLRRTA